MTVSGTTHLILELMKPWLTIISKRHSRHDFMARDKNPGKVPRLPGECHGESWALEEITQEERIASYHHCCRSGLESCGYC
jgi:hypothetical protein